jgi:hypothetical protein
VTRNGADARPRPYEQYFGSDQSWDTRVDAMASEARDRGLDPSSPEEFSRLAESRAALRRLLTGDESQEVRTQLGALLFQAWHFRRAQQKVASVTTDVAHALVAQGPGDRWELDRRSGAGYVKLPAGLFTAPGPEEAPSVWMAGFFWTVGGGRLILLVVLAAEGGDFTLLPLPPLPLRVAGVFARETVRQSGDDFAADPPGDGVYAVATAGEMLKLAIRALWRLAKSAPPVTESDPADPDLGDRPS